MPHRANLPPPADVPAAARPARAARACALATWGLLLVLCLLWELWLAPLRPGGSWLALKALPLLGPARGMAAGRLRSFQAALLLSLAYLAEGIVRLFEPAPVRQLAAAELALVAGFFVAAVIVLRPSRAAAAARKHADAAAAAGASASSSAGRGI